MGNTHTVRSDSVKNHTAATDTDTSIIIYIYLSGIDTVAKFTLSLLSDGNFSPLFGSMQMKAGGSARDTSDLQLLLHVAYKRHRGNESRELPHLRCR